MQPKMKTSDKIAVVIVVFLIIVFVSVIALSASAFCNRVVAPFITGSNDPLVAATYCKVGK
jgi:hypothetical protein